MNKLTAQLKPILDKLNLADPKTQKIVIAVCVLLAGALYMTQVRPKQAALTEAQNNLAAVKADVQQKQTTLSLSNGKKNGTKKPKKLNGKVVSRAVNRALPKKVQWENELNRLDKLASYTHVQLGDVSPDDQSGAGATTTGGFGRATASMSVSGTLSNCLRFIGGLHGMVQSPSANKLTAYGPLWGIDSVALTSNGPNKVTMQLQAAIFTAASSATTGQGTTPPASGTGTATPPATGTSTPPAGTTTPGAAQ